MSIVGAVWGMLSDPQQDGVLDDVGQDGADRYKLYFDTLLEAAGGKRSPSWRVLIPLYRSRPNAAWDAMQVEFPKEWAKQRQEWDRLEAEHGAEVPRVVAPPVVQPAPPQPSPPPPSGPAFAPVQAPQLPPPNA